MISSIFHWLIYDPLYNGLVFLISIVPGEEVGIAVILLTIMVRILLFPLTRKMVKTQITMRKIAPQVNELKEKYKTDQQTQVQKMLELYRKHEINPFAGILTLLIQLPIIFGLYWVFFRGGLPSVDPSLLYPFTPVPDAPNMMFLELIDMGGRSVVLAVLAGFAQFVHAKLSIHPPTTNGSGFQADLAKSFHIQMRYVFPILVAVIAYYISAAVALYWLTSNLVSIAQEFIVRRTIRDKEEVQETSAAV